MRIVCPTCQATYEVPERLIGSGRSLRCKACGHDWHVAPPGPAAPPQPPSPQPVPREEPAAPAAHRPPPLPTPRPRAPQVIDPPLPPPEDDAPRDRLVLRVAWAVSLLAVLGMLLALWLFRAEIAAAWPPAARLFQLLGGLPQG